MSDTFKNVVTNNPPFDPEAMAARADEIAAAFFPAKGEPMRPAPFYYTSQAGVKILKQMFDSGENLCLKPTLTDPASQSIPEGMDDSDGS